MGTDTTTVGGAPNTIRCMASRLPGASDPTACFSAEQVVDGATAQPSAPAKPVITQAMVQGWAEQAASTLTVPASAPSVGPDPANNQWKMLAVGLPVWVWTKDPQTASQTSTTNGITITFRAIRSATTIAWGDGSTSTCATMTARPASAEPMQASPDCGHVYRQKLTATITATSVWTVFWSALGFSGALYVPRSASTQLTVGQLHSVVVHR